MAKPRSINELISDYRAELARHFFYPDCAPGKAECGNVSFIGMDVFSYGSPILRFIRVDDDKKPLLEITATPYSVTSSKHKSIARAAAYSTVGEITRWTTPMPDCSTTNRYAPEYLLELVDKAISQMRAPRIRHTTKVGALFSFDKYLDDYTLFVKHAGMRTNGRLAAMQQGRKNGTEDEYIMHCRALAALNA